MRWHKVCKSINRFLSPKIWFLFKLPGSWEICWRERAKVERRERQEQKRINFTVVKEFQITASTNQNQDFLKVEDHCTLPRWVETKQRHTAEKFSIKLQYIDPLVIVSPSFNLRNKPEPTRFNKMKTNKQVSDLWRILNSLFWTNQ